MASALHMHGTEHAGLHNLFITCITCEAPPGPDMHAQFIRTVVCFGCMAFRSFCSMSCALHALHTLEKARQMTSWIAWMGLRMVHAKTLLMQCQGQGRHVYWPMIIGLHASNDPVQRDTKQHHPPLALWLGIRSSRWLVQWSQTDKRKLGPEPYWTPAFAADGTHSLQAYTTCWVIWTSSFI